MKITIAPHIGLLLFLLTSPSAVASNWQLVADDEKMRTEIDVATLARNGNIVKAWERETYHKLGQAKPGDFYFKSAKSLAQHHCTERTTSYLFRAFFAADGSEIKTIDSGAGADLDKVDFLPPDSLEERKLIFACARSAKKTAKPVPAKTEPPASAIEPTPAKPAEKNIKPSATAKVPAKVSASSKPEKAPEAKPQAAAQPAAAPPGKTSAGK